MPTRWNATTMIDRGNRLFHAIHRKKRLANPNHEIHNLARKLHEWLPEMVQSLIDGTYSPRYLKRHYFEDNVVDALYLPNRVLQHILLHELKSTFKAVISKNCYHLNGPHGVKLATARVRDTLAQQQPKYLIRADIKSYYASIPHYDLIQDIKKYYDDPKVQILLERVIRNALETKRGYKNPDHGITLRGPLSQFFSAIYLKPLDDAFDEMKISYIRYQDDIIIFCKTKRQLNRCRRRMMEILHQRHLTLSRKKSRIGRVDQGFHFLGVDYPALSVSADVDDEDLCAENKKELITQQTNFLENDALEARPQENTTVITFANAINTHELMDIHYPPPKHSQQKLLRSVPHPRTLRNARERVRFMILDGLSIQTIQSYLNQWALWWTLTVDDFSINVLLTQFINACWDTNFAIAVIAEGVRQQVLKKIVVQHEPQATLL